MLYLLDTNICIYSINRKPEEFFLRLEKEKPSDVGISSVTVAELYYGVFKSEQQERNLAALVRFLTPFELISFIPEMSVQYGKIRTALEKRGKPIGPFDMMIAATAIHLDITLVTNNTREFERMPLLKVTNWLK